MIHFLNVESILDIVSNFILFPYLIWLNWINFNENFYQSFRMWFGPNSADSTKS